MSIFPREREGGRDREGEHFFPFCKKGGGEEGNKGEGGREGGRLAYLDARDKARQPNADPKE